MSDVRAAERVLEIVNRPNIVDNIDRWYEIEPLAKALANAYLAEHPADESLDVDEDWLVQIGFQPDASGALWIGDYRLCWFKAFSASMVLKWKPRHAATCGVCVECLAWR